MRDNGIWAFRSRGGRLIKTLGYAVCVLACMVLVFGCGGRRHDGRLVHVAEIVSESPKEALALIDSIDSDSLTKADRHYLDFLKIKASDKAYILHQSDSLILDVINYASSHKDEGWYAEALYYGGRVYSDLGDLPTALRYFQEAHDESADSKDIEFRGAIYSQTGATLHDLRLYSEAIPYIHKSIGVSDMLKDTLNLMYDYSTLCQLYTNNHQLDSATKYNRKALRLAKTLSKTDASNMEIHRAAILYKQRNIDSALSVIRPLPSLVDTLSLNLTLALASEIYHEKGEYDTAYYYARELALRNRQDNRKTGFRIMFSPELRKIVPNDTLLKYLPMYKEMIEQYLDNHEAQQTMIQNANYNYQLHVREREKSEKRANDTKFVLVLALVLISVLISVILAMRLRQLKQQIQLRKYIDVIENLKADRQDGHLSINQEELKKKFFEDLEKIEKEEKPPVSEKILDSDEYRMLRRLIEENKIINEDGMRRIEDLVDRVSPQFKTRLQILTNGKMRRSDLEIALLIRCGVTTSEMAILLSLMKNSISSRRSSLAKKIMGLENKTRLLDKLILKI